MKGNPELIKERLAAVSYYRLSGYWYPFRNADDSFRPDTHFDEIWKRYVFDRRLRLLVIDAIERIEIAIRTQLSYQHAHQHGPFAYATQTNSLPKLSPSAHRQFIDRIQEEVRRSKEPFVAHFQEKYGDVHPMPPVWIASEIMSFGTILTFYRGCTRQVKQSIASVFGLPDKVFDSWLMTLNAVRNICAHHGRLWNREIGVKPLIPRPPKYTEWRQPIRVDNNRVFAVLTICRYCLRITAPQSRWADRLRELIAQSPNIPAPSMGFPERWEQCPIWSTD
jgi:abortive infection bacteriophage resistance protein